MKRVVVIGSSCVGKTTFARELASLLNVPHIELDALNWLEDWKARPPEELRALVTDAIAEPAWVLDGNYWSLRDLVWARATTLIWLNYSFPVVWQRALRRTLRRVFTQEALYSGNRESFRQSFMSRDSILLWVMQAYSLRRREYRKVYDEDRFAEVEKIEFKRPREADRYLRAVKEALMSRRV